MNRFIGLSIGPSDDVNKIDGLELIAYCRGVLDGMRDKIKQVRWDCDRARESGIEVVDVRYWSAVGEVGRDFTWDEFYDYLGVGMNG